MQSSLTHLITALHPWDPGPTTPLGAHGSVHQVTPQAQVRNAPEAFNTPPTAGSGVLHDVETGKELHLDGTVKQPYRHPHFGQIKQPAQPPVEKQGQPQVTLPDQQQQLEQVEVQVEGQRRPGRDPLLTDRRNPTLVKPAKMNMPEFEGDNTDSWIQTMDLYFDAARTPPETKTEIAVTYLKGPAIEWWRGTGYIAATMP